jgi:hypothetical protein
MELMELPQSMAHRESPVQYFKEMVDSDIITKIYEQTNSYSVQSDPDKPVNVTPSESEQFMGSLLYMPICGLPLG